MRALSFKTQALTLLAVSAIWLTTSMATLVVGETGKYNPISWLLTDLLPFALLILGATLALREHRQRVQHPGLFYSSVLASVLPIVATAVRLFVGLGRQ